MGRKREPPKWIGRLASSRWLPLPLILRVALRHWYVARRLGMPMSQVGVVVSHDESGRDGRGGPPPDPT